MTRMLASVNSLAEARLVYRAGADIIDLKQPAEGALGALPLKTVCEIRAWCMGKIPVSATIGDLPMQPGPIVRAIKAMAATGVDYIKIGFFPGGDRAAVLQELALTPVAGHQALIAVLFGDALPEAGVIADLRRAGFAGVMLDTMDKSRGSLLDVLPLAEIERFVNAAQEERMLCGLAGSLRLEDIAVLRRLKPDYLGFRGALCAQRQRTAELDPAAVASIGAAVKAKKPDAKGAASA